MSQGRVSNQLACLRWGGLVVSRREGRSVFYRLIDSRAADLIATARAMCGAPVPYNEVPWFWSDQYDVNIQLVGLPDGWSETVTRGDREAGQFIVFYLKDGRIDGAAALNPPRDLPFPPRPMPTRRCLSTRPR